jgi:CRISPR-associated endonuclease Csn1
MQHFLSHKLPKSLLNELNKLRISGEPIDVQTKQELFNDLFMTKTDIKLSTIKEWFKTQGKDDDVAIADSVGTGGTINHKMTSYHKFKSIFNAALAATSNAAAGATSGAATANVAAPAAVHAAAPAAAQAVALAAASGKTSLTDDDMLKLLPKIEEAILSITVLPDDKEMLRERIATIFSDELLDGTLNDEGIKKIANFNFTKWGNFSNKLLDGIRADVGGRQLTIIDALWETNQNFMELAAGSGTFAPKISEYQEQNGIKSTEELIDSSYASVPVKRACRQAIKIVHELESIIGCKPAKVFIEAPRSHEDSKRTDDRKRQLSKIYDGIKSDVQNYKATKEDLKNYENADLKPKAVYLYFLQNGRCAYSGESLDIGSLTTTCDIDHIVPQTMLKDDSFDNLVLVKKELNRAKSDTYPLNTVAAINFASMLAIWKAWHKNGMMSDKKLRSLTRTTLTMDEIAGFINRQLVETSQTTKMVMDILKLVMPDTDIVYQKAETVAEFKREWAHYEGETKDGRFVPILDENGEKKLKRMIKPQFIKVRDLNDLHHAKDAYLNIVVGNVYATKFTNNPRAWLRSKYQDKAEAVKLNMRTVMYDDRKVLEDGSRGEVKSLADGNGIIVWDEECLQTVIKTYERNDILVSVRAFAKHGAIFDQNLLKFEEGKIRFPIKKGMDVKKYGGYSGSYSVYFAYIKTARGKKRFAAIPLRNESNPNQYLNEEFPGCEVLLPRVPFKSTLLVKGHPVTLDGSSGTNMMCSNYKNLMLSNSDASYLAKILKAKDRITATRGYLIDEKYDRISANKNAALYRKFVDLAKSQYNNRPNVTGVIQFLEENRDEFLRLELTDQVTMLVNILKLFQRVPFSSSAVDCSLLGGKKNTGNTQFSTYEEDIKLIIPSVTGLYKKVIDLSKLGVSDVEPSQLQATLI